MLEEWIPKDIKTLTRDEALAKLAIIYVTGHGPVTAQDLSMRSSLSVGECKKALSMIEDKVETMTIDKTVYYYVSPKKAAAKSSTLLLAAFDEYFLGYKDRSPIADIAHHKKIYSVNGIFSPTITVDGYVVGIWKRTVKKDTVMIELNILDTSRKVDMKAIEKDAQRFTDFL